MEAIIATQPFQLAEGQKFEKYRVSSQHQRHMIF